MKFIIHLSILFTILVLNSKPVYSSDKEIYNGLTDIYNLKFDDAENKFRQFQIDYPKDIKGYFYESLLYFYKALPTRNEQQYERFLELSEKVIDRGESLLEKNENDYDALYYTGLSHSYRSLLMLSLDKSLLSAASNGNDGYRILSALIEKKPDYYDAYMGLGLYKIAIGFVPEKFQWLLNLIGFNGNINEGRNLLKTSMNKGKFTRVDSKAFLSLFSLKEKEDEDGESLRLSRELSEDYPQSAVFRIFYSTILLQNGFNDEAILQSNESLNLNKYSFQNEIKKAAYSIRGISYFRLNDYEKASEDLEESMKYVYPSDRYNVYLFTLGVSYELTGNRQNAVEKYKLVRNNFINERDGELDRFFYRYAQYKIKNPLTEFEMKLIEGMNYRESNKINEAIELYNDMIESKLLFGRSDDDLLKFYFDAGLAYELNKNNDKAIECFRKCLSHEPENEKWIVPHAYFELGKIYNRLGDKIKSEDMFEKIFDYDDFDFESFLEMRLANYKNK